MTVYHAAIFFSTFMFLVNYSFEKEQITECIVYCLAYLVLFLIHLTSYSITNILGSKVYSPLFVFLFVCSYAFL